MSENSVTVVRRVNLGNYEHYELVVTIYDENEFSASARALVLMASMYQALGIKETIDISKVQKGSY